MLKREIKGKGGQFYIIAAIIIIVIIIAVYSAGNYAFKRKTETKIYDLSKELDFEGEQVLNYGLYKSEDSKALMSDFIKSYETIVESGSNLVLVYGDATGYTVATYQDVLEGEFGIEIGSTSVGLPIERRKFEMNDTIVGGGDDKKVVVQLTEGEKAYDYTFNLEEGQNFFFIIKKGGDVARNAVVEVREV